MHVALTLLVAGLVVACGQLPPVAVPTPPRPGAQAVVFDIDGTLTPTVLSVAVARADAAQAVGAYARKGYAVVYLSTRVSLLQAGVPRWLADHGFPAGVLHVAQTPADHDRPDAFKARMLQAYTASGWRFVAAYGDSSTDFAAYAQAGIAQHLVYALQREGDAACQPGVWRQCLRGWTEHLGAIEQLPAARP